MSHSFESMYLDMKLFRLPYFAYVNFNLLPNLGNSQLFFIYFIYFSAFPPGALRGRLSLLALYTGVFPSWRSTLHGRLFTALVFRDSCTSQAGFELKILFASASSV